MHSGCCLESSASLTPHASTCGGQRSTRASVSHKAAKGFYEAHSDAAAGLYMPMRCCWLQMRYAPYLALSDQRPSLTSRAQQRRLATLCLSLLQRFLVTPRIGRSRRPTCDPRYQKRTKSKRLRTRCAKDLTGPRRACDSSSAALSVELLLVQPISQP